MSRDFRPWKVEGGTLTIHYDVAVICATIAVIVVELARALS